MREGVELSSACVRTVGIGEKIEIIAKSFSDVPETKCIPRFQLADGSGSVFHVGVNLHLHLLLRTSDERVGVFLLIVCFSPCTFTRVCCCKTKTKQKQKQNSWVSQKLNRPPPNDTAVMNLIGSLPVRCSDRIAQIQAERVQR